MSLYKPVGIDFQLQQFFMGKVSALGLPITPAKQAAPYAFAFFVFLNEDGKRVV